MKFLFLPLMLLATSCFASNDSVVLITTDYGRASGFVVYADNQMSGVLTTMHSCTTNYLKGIQKREFTYAEKIKVNNEDGTILAIDMFHDLCFIEVNVVMKPMKLTRRFDLRRKDVLHVLSPGVFGDSKAFYFGEDWHRDDLTPYHMGSYEIVGSFENGQSGSPVVNEQGEVLATFWGIDNKNGHGYVVGLSAITRFISKASLMIYEGHHGVQEIKE